MLSAFLFLFFQGHMVSGEDILKTLLSTNILGDFHIQFRVSTVFGTRKAFLVDGKENRNQTA